jgi:nitroimidazol reductase NimA-like FMN-containing flavoprotein (pyridoxamine 5'-phosphate oxidase superfamily)
MTNLEQTERTRLRRIPERGSYDRAVIHGILDEGLVGHLAFAVDGKPWAIPMVYGRIDDTVYVHGAAANHALRSSAPSRPAPSRTGGEIEVCFEVTLVDGLVLARSAFHHSMNYRSVMIFGSARRVEDLGEKERALAAVVEHVVPGRTADARPPTETELRTTLVLALALDEASAKVRTGGPSDEAEDLALPVWAGVIPLTVVPGAPVADEHTAPTTAAPGYATDYRRPEARP